MRSVENETSRCLLTITMESVYLSISQKPDNTVKNIEQLAHGETQSLLHFTLRMCRKHGLIKDRVTLVSPSDFLQILQLCQAQVHKKMGKDFHADDTEVFTLAQMVFAIKQRKAFTEVQSLLQNALRKDGTDSVKPACNSQDILGSTPCKSSQQSFEEVNASTSGENERLSEAILQEYDRFLINSNHIDAIDVLRVFLLELLSSQFDSSELHADLACLHLERTGSSQDPLQELIAEQLILGQRPTSEDCTADPSLVEKGLMICEKSTLVKCLILQPDKSTDGNPDSEENNGEDVEESDLTKELVSELFHSYLQLLVNTRSELAFAHVFNTPDRGLTHRAFTHLKHQAQKKNMSLYQTAMSVIMQLRLGGSGYAPGPNNKLLEYVKGFSDLSDLMNKLQQLLEDTQCVRSSVLRVVGVVRKNLIGCKSQRYKRETVEAMAGQIQKDLEHVCQQLQLNSILISPDKPACQGGSLTSRRPRRVLLHYLDQVAASLWGETQSPHHTWLQDIPFGPHTPSRFPCVLSQFRSPACLSSPANGKGREKEPAQKKRKMIVSTNLPGNSDQPLLQRCAKRLSDTVIVLPSKTIVHPAESRSSCLAQEPALHDQENLHPEDIPARKKSKKTTSSSSNPTTSSAGAPLRMALKENGQKRVQLQPSSSQPKKQPPKAGKKCRRRLLSPIKGQKPITSFFKM